MKRIRTMKGVFVGGNPVEATYTPVKPDKTMQEISVCLTCDKKKCNGNCKKIQDFRNKFKKSIDF